MYAPNHHPHYHQQQQQPQQYYTPPPPQQPQQYYTPPPPPQHPQPHYSQSQPQGAYYAQAPHNHTHTHAHAHHQARPAPGPAVIAPIHDPLWQYFTAVDKDRSGNISLAELHAALVNGNWTPFDIDTVKMLMTMFDTNKSGSINFREFRGLWDYIKRWQDVFRTFDNDASGTIEGAELSKALTNFGYKLTPKLLTLIERKYASATAVGDGPPPGITFDRFVRACVVVRNLTEAFQRTDTDNDGWIHLDYENFMTIILSAP
ncbi:EF-hand [Mycena kentingensis (nom. inval.)]|nr:EF-hand [Mycena kentingensis (nom. inval.)]